MQSLKHIKAYLFLHGKDVSKKAVDKFLSILQSDIKSGKITKAKDSYCKEVDRIQRSLVGMSNVMLPAEVAKIEIEAPRKKHYEKIVSGLGSIIPAMVSGAAGKVTEAIILNLFKAKTGLSGLSGDISEAEKNKWIAIHTKQLEKAELDLEKANTKEGIIEAKKQIKWLTGALKNARALTVHGLNGEVKKPSGTILSKDKAQKLCSDWHDGQNSALYQFASSKVFVPENFDKYIFEIESIQRHLATSTGKAYKDMQSLKKFFQYKNWELNKSVSGVSKGTLLATSPTEEGILAIINKYFYSTTFKLVDGVLHNSKGPVNNFTVEQKKGRYRFMQVGSISGIKTDQKALKNYLKKKGEKLPHGYKLAKRKKGKKKSAKKKTVNPIKKVATKKTVKKKTVVKKVAPIKKIEVKKIPAEKKKVLKKVSFIFSRKPETFEEAVLLYFLKNGKISTSDFKRYTGFGVKNERTGKTHGSKEFKSYIWAYKNKAISIDNLVYVLWVEDMNMPEGNFEEQDLINEFFNILTSHKGKKSMLDSLLELQKKTSSNDYATPAQMREAEDAAEAEKFFNTYPLSTKEITDFIEEQNFRNDFEKKYEQLAGTKKKTKLRGPQKSARKQDGFVGVGTISEMVDGVLTAMKAERSGTKTVATKKHNTHLLPVYRKVEVMPVENISAPAQTQVQTSTVKTEGTMSGAEMGSMTFEKLNFNDYYKGIFGSPATNFDMCIDGSPGSGKTTFLLMFANYLADFHGPTLFVTTEEFGSATLIDKVNRFNIKSKNLYFAKKVPALDELKKYKFVFIDSINHAKITIEQYQAMREKAAKTAFILVLQQTKSGSYKGSTDWPHEVEITMSLFKDEFDERNLKISKDRYTDPVPRVVKI